jgi:CCR4-NOT transcription complex subunit 1 CAF1-binding domain
MGIMALLAEIYALDRLKLNLKFEIEMVFRNLGLQVRLLVTCSSTLLVVVRHGVITILLNPHACLEWLTAILMLLAPNPEPAHYAVHLCWLDIALQP